MSYAVIGISVIASMNFKWGVMVFIAMCPYFAYMLLFRILGFLRKSQNLEFFFFPCIVFTIFLALIQKSLGAYDGFAP